MWIKKSNCQEVKTARDFKTLTKKWRRALRDSLVQIVWVNAFGLKHKRPVAKWYGSSTHSSSVGSYHVLVIEEQDKSGGVHRLVVTRRDFLPRHDGGRLQTCTVRGDKSDRRNQVGVFYIKKDHVNDPQESGYCSTIGVTGSVPPPTVTAHSPVAEETVVEESESMSGDVTDSVPPPTLTAHTLIARETAEEESGSTGSTTREGAVSEDLEGGAEPFSLRSGNTMGQNCDIRFVGSSTHETCAASHTVSSDTTGLVTPKAISCISNSEKDGGACILDSSASVAEKNMTICDDEVDGPCSTSHLKDEDKDSALGFPTPASLDEAQSQDFRSSVMSDFSSGISQSSAPAPSHSPRHPASSAQPPSPPHPRTRGTPIRLPHSNNTEVVQSISYTTNSFRKATIGTEKAKDEPQPSTAAAQAHHDSTPPTTQSARHQRFPKDAEAHDGAIPAGGSCSGGSRGVGSGDVAPTTRAEPETSVGKSMDSLCVSAAYAPLPAPMKAGLATLSPIRLRLGEHVDGSSSDKRFTLSSRQESKSTRRVLIPEGKQFQAGCILCSSIAAFEEGSFLPLPSREAVERSIGKGGNGTISIVYFKGLEFAVKRTHFRQMEVEILSSLHHDNILPLQAVMMGEEDPQRPSRFLCYHFLPRMSGDLQSYLTKVGHGALSNLLMQHKEDPTMLQLVVDNTKHILRSILKGLAYLHSSHIVHNDVKPSNFLTTTQCGCVSPLTCDHGQRFAVKLSDFDSAMDVTKVRTRHSVLRQLYRNNPTGTPGYRPPEYVLVATRTRDELDNDMLTAADVWAFGCSVLKIFLSHSGPYTQKQMAFLHLWHNGGCPREREGERARVELKLGLLERVYPNWPHLWSFVAECMKVSPNDRMQCSKLSEHPFFAS